jgi:hypothetical protein
MEISKGVSCIMNKNIIYKLVGVVTLLLVGEGILGWAVYWPALWFLLDWKFVYWLAFGLGFLLTGVTGLAIGWSSLVLIVGVWTLSFVKGLIGKSNWIDVLVVVGVAGVVNLLADIEFSLVEAALIALVMVFFKMRANREGTLRI